MAVSPSRSCVYHSNFVTLRHKHNVALKIDNEEVVVYIIQIL